MPEVLKNQTVLREPTDIGDFLIVGRAEEHRLDFTCYEVVGQELNGQPGWVFNRNEWETLPDLVSDYREAQPFLSGAIKWDGCANVKFDEQDSTMLHFCGRDDAAKIGKLFNALYDLAEKLIPAWDD